MYVLSDALIDYWNKQKICLSIKQKFLQSLGLDPGEYRFTAYCAFVWEDEESPCTAMGWDEYRKFHCKTITIITLGAFVNWSTGKKKKEKKEKPIKEDKNVNRLQKQKTQIDRGDFPEGNRIKGRACQVTIGIGHLSYQAIKS